MIKSQFLVLSLILCLCSSGCTQGRTYLSEEIKNINPYKVGQKLIFVSNHGMEDSLQIIEVDDKKFVDALGAPKNEGMFVDASLTDGDEVSIVKFYAHTGKETEQVDFNIALRYCALVMKSVSFTEYLKRTEMSMSTSLESYEDILVFDRPVNSNMPDRAIVEFWWSKSKGYVRLIQKNGIIWDLKSLD